MSRSFLVPQTDPGASYDAHKEEIDAAIKKVLESGTYILGKEVKDFEQEFSSYIGVDFAVGVASGTDAIEISLRAMNIGRGDVVFTVSHTAVATVAAIERAGAVPYLIDISPETFTIDTDKLEKEVKTCILKGGKSPGDLKAIVPVHLYGHPADMPTITAIAKNYGLHIVEDCSQAHGSECMNKKVGSFGEMAAFSFYPTKNLGAVGDGGMVVTNNPDYIEKLHALRQYGWENRYVSSFAGINSRLDELQAGILRIKLKYLDKENKKRREIAGSYTNALQGKSIKTPKITNNASHVFHQYVIQTNNRSDLISYLQSKSIATGIHYPMPIHLQPAYKDKILVPVTGLEITEEICQKIVSLPMYPQMTTDSINYVCEALNRWSI